MRIEEMRQLFKDVHTEEDIKKILSEHEGLEAQIRQMDKANMAELSDEELENVVGGISGNRSIAMILASLTIISSSAQIAVTSGSFMSPVTVSAAEFTTEEKKADVENKTEVQPEANAAVDMKNQPKANAAGDIKKNSETSAENGLKKQPETGVESETKKQSETKAESETKKQPETKAESETKKQPETKAESTTEVQKKVKKPSVSDSDVEKKIRKKLVSSSKTIIAILLSNVPVIGNYLRYVAIDLFKDDSQNLNAEHEEIKNALNDIDDKLDQQTREIIGAVNKSSVITYVDNFNDKIENVKIKYSNYNAGVIKNLKWIGEGNGEARAEVIKTNFQKVHSAVNDNNDYYDQFIKMGNAFVGDAFIKVNDIKNIFDVYHGVLANKYNYNTQTFEDRKEFNQKIMNIYMTGYTVIKSAIEYDISLMDERKAANDEAIKELNQFIKDNQLTEEQLAKVDNRLNEIIDENENFDIGISNNKDKLDNLDNQKSSLEKVIEEQNDKLAQEDAKDYVLCYRNGVKYKRNLTSVFSTPENTNDNNKLGGKYGNLFKQYYSSNIETFFRHYLEIAGSLFSTEKMSVMELLKDKWNVDDNNISNSIYGKSASNLANKQHTVNKLNEFAAAKGKTLYEDISTAFKLPEGKTAADFKGIYNGGGFKTSEEHNKEHLYIGTKKKKLLFFITVRTDEFYSRGSNVCSIIHEVDYYSAGDKGAAKKTSFTRKFQIAENPHSMYEHEKCNFTPWEMYRDRTSYNGEKLPLLMIEKY